MNIFFLHLDPQKCAEFYADKHVVKIIIEIAQMMSAAHHLLPCGLAPPYRKTHANHPCAVWVRASAANYDWTLRLFRALCAEYTHRYGRTHKCESFADAFDEFRPRFPSQDFTMPALAIHEAFKFKCRRVEDAVDAYRCYYFIDKHELLAWRRRDPPPFIADFRRLFE